MVSPLRADGIAIFTRRIPMPPNCPGAGQNGLPACWCRQGGAPGRIHRECGLRTERAEPGCSNRLAFPSPPPQQLVAAPSPRKASPLKRVMFDLRNHFQVSINDRFGHPGFRPTPRCRWFPPPTCEAPSPCGRPDLGRDASGGEDSSPCPCPGSLAAPRPRRSAFSA